MDFKIVDSSDYATFHHLLNQYYREGEDEDTSQDQVDGFIQMLFDMVQQGKINCRLITADKANIGFVLWAIDTEALDFSEIPGMGTVLEIGIGKPYRRSGMGTKIVEYVDDAKWHHPMLCICLWTRSGILEVLRIPFQRKNRGKLPSNHDKISVNRESIPLPVDVHSPHL